MTIAATGLTNESGTGAETTPFILESIPTSCVGEVGSWIQISTCSDTVTLTPTRPMPRRCTIKPAALFEDDRGVHEVNIVMGRLVFKSGATEPQTYQAYSKDKKRTLRELFFPIEPMPEDDQPASRSRWRNCQAIAKQLLRKIDVTWDGFSHTELEMLVRYVARHEPLDACVMHALAQHTKNTGDMIIEVGSYRGSSGAVQAMGLRAAGSDAMLVSIDPHQEWPCNRDQVRLSLREVGEEQRLVQFQCISDRAARMLRPQSASMIFIDGDHEYDQVVADFRNYVELLAPGGMLMFHDYCWGDHDGLPEPQPGVRRAVDEFAFTCEDLQPLMLAHTLMVFQKTS